MREFLSSRATSNIRSVVARERNNLVRAINDQGSLPKLIVVILDDDILKCLKGEAADTVKYQIPQVLNWLIKEFEKLISGFKDILPSRAKRHHMPHVLWIKPPQHKNFGDSWNMLRYEMGEILQQITETKLCMTTLPMLKIWGS